MTVLTGDCLEVLPTLDAESIDACVTDPPYALTNRVADVPACDSCGRQWAQQTPLVAV